VKVLARTGTSRGGDSGVGGTAEVFGKGPSGRRRVTVARLHRRVAVKRISAGEALRGFGLEEDGAGERAGRGCSSLKTKEVGRKSRPDVPPGYPKLFEQGVVSVQGDSAEACLHVDVVRPVRTNGVRRLRSLIALRRGELRRPEDLSRFDGWGTTKDVLECSAVEFLIRARQAALLVTWIHNEES